MILTPDEFLEWKQLEITKEFFKALKAHREIMKEALINGLYENEEFAKGKATALKQLIEMTYEDMMEILNDK